MSSEFSPELRKELLDDFYAECDELLTAIRRELSVLERSVATGNAVRAPVELLFRSVHSVKGNAAIAGVASAEQLAHAMEDLLRALTKNQVRLSPDRLDLLLDGAQRLESMLTAHRKGEALPDYTDLADALRRSVGLHANETAAGPATPGEPPPIESPTPGPAEIAAQRGLQLWRCTFAPSESLDRRGVNVSSVRERLGRIGEILSAVPSVRPNASIVFEFTLGLLKPPDDLASWQADGIMLEPLPAGDGQPEATTGAPPERREPAPLAPSRIVRVDLGRLDELMRIAGELVIQRSRLEDRIQQQFRGDESLKEIDLGFARSLRELRKAIMHVRLVPIAEIFSRIPFAVRDLARDSEKKVRVVLEGQQTEIDKYLAERLSDPLLHLVRNAVAHGIETPAERVAAGKPPEATLLVRATSAGDSVVVRMRDDGRGIDRQKIAARAKALGIPTPEDLDANALLQVLSASGFSTRELADRTAGRGIGMGVVVAAVRELGGMLTLDTSVGQGTEFTLRLPLTLSIVDAIIVSVGDETCAVPQRAVVEIFQVPAREIRTIRQTEVVPYREGLLPFRRLGAIFETAPKSAELMTLLVLSTETGATGLLVDRVRSRREVVVRPLSDPLVRVPGVAGATELGDGKPILILDPIALTAGVVRPLAGAGDAALRDVHS